MHTHTHTPLLTQRNPTTHAPTHTSQQLPLAHKHRPAIVISFIIAGISALLSALCYSEFAVQYPFAGGAYNYISISMGELAAWLVVTTLVLVRLGFSSRTLTRVSRLALALLLLYLLGHPMYT